MLFVQIALTAAAYEEIHRMVQRRTLLAMFLTIALLVGIEESRTKWDRHTWGEGKCYAGDERVRCDSDILFKRTYDHVWDCLGDKYDPPDCVPAGLYYPETTEYITDGRPVRSTTYWPKSYDASLDWPSLPDFSRELNAYTPKHTGCIPYCNATTRADELHCWS